MSDRKSEPQECPNPSCKDKIEEAIENQCKMISLMRDDIKRHSVVIFGDESAGVDGIVKTQKQQSSDIRKIKLYGIITLVGIIGNSVKPGLLQWLIAALSIH